MVFGTPMKVLTLEFNEMLYGERKHWLLSNEPIERMTGQIMAAQKCLPTLCCNKALTHVRGTIMAMTGADAPKAKVKLKGGKGMKDFLLLVSPDKACRGV
jgi:hypothetical protein